MTKAADIRQIVAAEVAKREPFVNFHGITIDNLESFLVKPFEVSVDPDDLETGVRPMWIVLQERDVPAQGYVVVYDVSDESWGVAEHVRNDQYVLVNSTLSFVEALNSM